MHYTTPLKAKSATTDLSRFKVVANNRGSARGELLDKFLARLNPARKADGYREYSHARIAVMLSHIPTDDLYAFYKQCEDAGIPFGAKFHYELKPRKNEHKKIHILGRPK